MRRIATVSCTGILLALGLFRIAGASMGPCFIFGGKSSNPDMACIVTKIEGSRLCMEGYHIPSKTRYKGETCEFIRDHGGARVGDRIVIDADEWKGYSDKCYKSPGCGKVTVQARGASPASAAPVARPAQSAAPAGTAGTPSAAISYRTLGEIWADRSRAAGRIAEIPHLFLKDWSPDEIGLVDNSGEAGKKSSSPNDNFILKTSPTAAATLKPLLFQRNLTVRFKINRFYDNFFIGEFIALGGAPSPAAAPPPRGGVPAAGDWTPPSPAPPSSPGMSVAMPESPSSSAAAEEVITLPPPPAVARPQGEVVLPLPSTPATAPASPLPSASSSPAEPAPPPPFAGQPPVAASPAGPSQEGGGQIRPVPPETTPSQSPPKAEAGEVEKAIQEALQKGVRKGMDALKGIFR